MSMYIYCICFFSVEFADGPCKDNQILTNTYSCSKMQRSLSFLVLSVLMVHIKIIKYWLILTRAGRCKGVLSHLSVASRLAPSSISLLTTSRCPD